MFQILSKLGTCIIIIMCGRQQYFIGFIDCVVRAQEMQLSI